MAEKDKTTEAEGQSAAMTREGAPKENNAGTQTAVADNTVTGTANASATAPATPEEVPSWATTDEQGRGRLEQMALQMAGENPTLTPEQKEAEAKERNKKMRWAKLNDAIAAMSNLYFTSKYAPNAFDPNNLATKKLRERYDKIDADRDKDRQAWYNVVMPAIKGDTENQRAYYQLQQQKQDKAADRAQQKAISDANINLALQKLDYQKAADELNRQLKQQELDETKRAHQANEAIARLNASLKGQGSNGRYPYYWLNDKNEVVLMYAPSQNEQQRRIDFAAANFGKYGIGAEDVMYRTGNDAHGQPIDKTQERVATYNKSE